jgi:hypothetical protein
MPPGQISGYGGFAVKTISGKVKAALTMQPPASQDDRAAVAIMGGTAQPMLVII